MRSLLGFLAIYSLIGALLLGVGTAIGFLLHWLVPGVDLGIAILIGVVTIGFSGQLFARILSIPLDNLDDEPEFGMPLTPQRVTYLIDPEPPRRARKRKPATTKTIRPESK